MKRKNESTVRQNMEIYNEPEKLLQSLIRFNTSNPPGYEKDCCAYIKELLETAGIKTEIYALDENRPNLRAEIKSENPVMPPIMLYGHIDVVPADEKDWEYPPFSGEISDGYIYGRGAADMKSAIAMFICVMLKVKRENIKLGFDLVLLILSDEENTGKYGAKFMVEKHPELFRNIAFAIGEVGGYSFIMGGKRFYPVMVAEKQCSSLKLTFRGKSGHGSSKQRDTAMEKMARAVSALSINRLKTRVTPEVSFMIKEIANGLGGVRGFVLKSFLNPVFTNIALDIAKEDGPLFDNLLHNSINVTIVRGGTAGNVIPGSVDVCADLRILPGCTMQEALDDINEVIRKKAGLLETDYEIAVTVYDKNDSKPILKYFDDIRRALIEADPDGIPVPFVVSASTDSRILSNAGVMTYGFIPSRVSDEFDFYSQFHAENERIPVSALTFGIDTLLLFLTRHCTEAL